MNPAASAFPVACRGVSERVGNIIIPYGSKILRSVLRRASNLACDLWYERGKQNKIFKHRLSSLRNTTHHRNRRIETLFEKHAKDETVVQDFPEDRLNMDSGSLLPSITAQ